MKVIFQQRRVDPNSGGSALAEAGITSCFLKIFRMETDLKSVNKRMHHHNGFEIHIVKKGMHVYKIEDEIVQVQEGQFLLITPGVKHILVNSVMETVRISMLFAWHAELPQSGSFLLSSTPTEVEEGIDFIQREQKNGKKFSPTLIENRVLEMAITFLRLAGMEEPRQEEDPEEEDPRLRLVKQYIHDNIELFLSVSELAGYGSVSTKQLNRLFLHQEGMTPIQYIQKCRIEAIESMLTQELTLREISEKMGFQNEYYFNTFVKRHLGMPPGAYRTMVPKQDGETSD